MKNSGVSSIFTRALVFIVMFSSLGACTAVIVPDGDAPSAAGTGGGGGFVPTSPLATFADTAQVAGLACAKSNCHDVGMPVLRDDAALYTTLTTYKASICGGRVLVKPGDPQESAFYLAQMGMCSGLPKMPLGCEEPGGRCTPEDRLEGIRQWIAAGAPQ